MHLHVKGYASAYCICPHIALLSQSFYFWPFVGENYIKVYYDVNFAYTSLLVSQRKCCQLLAFILPTNFPDVHTAATEKCLMLQNGNKAMWMTLTISF